MRNFDPKTVALRGVNLVEASAGTGKTYSVAILVLRLIVEKKVPIQRILMVTFTNAAVAEMAHRIRKFIRLGMQAAQGVEIGEQNIREYILEKSNHIDPQEIINRLNTALIGLDEASIQTIHSFCHDSLKLFAFETGQAFGLKLQEDLSDSISLAAEEYWRNHVTGLPKDLLAEMEQNKISLQTLKEAVKESLGGKSFDFEGNETPREAWEAWQQEFYGAVENQRSSIIQAIEQSTIKGLSLAKKSTWIEKFQDDPESCLNELKSSKSNYVMALREEIFSDLLWIFDNKTNALKSTIKHCIQFAKEQLTTYLKKNHLLTYDDMISRLHQAVLSNEDLVAKLSDRYDAVFIDEFQDTDKLQYEIYDRLYGEKKTLFYIGDPKQSIYGWRKADLNTYFQASTKAGVTRYTMGTNYRSTSSLLDSLNSFFSIENPFLDSNIPYLPVTSGLGNQRKVISKGTINLEPIQIYESSNKGDIPEKVVALVADLITGDTKLDEKKIKLSDIAILVRTKNEGKGIKQELTRKGIPAVNVDETKIFETEEAEYLEYILQTTLEISWKGVNKALLNKFTGWKSEDLLSKDSDQLVSKFKEYQKTWADQGVYTMIRKYIQDFGVLEYLFRAENPAGKRVYSNLSQLMEILQEKEYRYELRPSGLLSYLTKQRAEESLGESEKYLQRLEDDQDAITIMTIHKAKGLEFPIVIAPYLNMRPKSTFTFSSFRKTDGTYCFYSNNLAPVPSHVELYKQQTEEENRRILYVALTRAIYHCFIFHVDSETESTLSPFIREENDQIKYFPADQFPFPEVKKVLSISESKKNLVFEALPDLELPDQNWRKLSFSYLTRKTKPLPKTASENYTNAYEEFVFKKLPKGASIGDLLHYIFERIDFQDQTDWTHIVEKAIKRFYPQFGEEMTEHLMELVDQVLSVSISHVSPDFSLNKVTKDKKVSEWEFDLSSTAFEPALLMSIPLQDDFLVRSVEGKALQGILNGLVDLIFEYEGKYYILDWKSNFLGDSLADYEEDKLLEAMNTNNYHLQYFLYSLALKQFLETYQQGFDFQRDFGGVIYLFLRGIRSGKTNGVFHYRPSMEQMEYLENLIIQQAAE